MHHRSLSIHGVGQGFSARSKLAQLRLETRDHSGTTFFSTTTLLSASHRYLQDAVRRYGNIIYGDTSVRYMTSNFDRIIIDNDIRGFSCRELPSHYLSCYTLSGTFTWLNETSTTFDDIYIAEAGFVAVTDNFLSRLVLKTWVTCALDPECISPSNSRTACARMGAVTGTHRFDQSAMVAVLSFFFFQSARQNDKTDPAPYDMFASIQQKVAEVRRFEGDNSYFTPRKPLDNKQNSSAANLKTA